MTHLTTLLLDLDETCMKAIPKQVLDSNPMTIEQIKSISLIHPEQQLSSSYFEYNGYYIFIINPDKLKKMIETIYAQGDDIYVFTSGLWEESILPYISKICGLESPYAEKWLAAGFLNSQHDQKALDLPLEDVRIMPKAYRLHGLFHSTPELMNRHFVLLDDNKAHIQSCSVFGLGYITSVEATTSSQDSSFYQTVLDEMAYAHDLSTNVSPRSPTYTYPGEILRHYFSIIQRDPLSQSDEMTLEAEEETKPSKHYITL